MTDVFRFEDSWLILGVLTSYSMDALPDCHMNTQRAIVDTSRVPFSTVLWTAFVRPASVVLRIQQFSFRSRSPTWPPFSATNTLHYRSVPGPLLYNCRRKTLSGPPSCISLLITFNFSDPTWLLAALPPLHMANGTPFTSTDQLVFFFYLLLSFSWTLLFDSTIDGSSPPATVRDLSFAPPAATMIIDFQSQDMTGNSNTSMS
ncbi:hypothetical protein Hypma_007106 [Hypsizygus marmoreus]|uniref:Uncharacterized protein n=1 Tax=Hypsizygus marmoreus TaxID=39966 RepID=A0A369K9S5_HYPMA|nr:hypothetical protein Hypma_007106 [Hypsizygus marmoreus]